MPSSRFTVLAVRSASSSSETSPRADLSLPSFSGNGNPSPDPAGPAEYTLVPYTPPAPVAAPAPAAASPQSQHGQEDSSFDSPYGSETLHLGRGATAPAKPPTYDFVDRRNVIQDPGQDIFGEDVSGFVQSSFSSSNELTRPAPVPFSFSGTRRRSDSTSHSNRNPSSPKQVSTSRRGEPGGHRNEPTAASLGL